MDHTAANMTIVGAPPLNPAVVATDVDIALTPIERTLLPLLAAGCTNAQIGQHLGRSEKTVRNQLTRVYAKLGVVNRAQAVAAHMRLEFRYGARDAS